MSTHGSHSSAHSSHSSSHSSHSSSHSQSGVISSSDSLTSSPAWSGNSPSTSTHTVTATQIASSLSTGNKISTVPSASGSLSALISVANQSRATVTSPNDAYTVSAQQITGANFKAAVESSAGVQGPFYALGTIKHTADAVLKKTGSETGSITVATLDSSKTNSSMTTTDTLASESLSVTGLAGTTKSASSGDVSFSQRYSATDFTPSANAPASGTKITSANLADALSRIKSISSSMSNFGTYNWTGTLQVTHASHSSHSSSHSSHSSSHTSHSSSHSSHSNCLRAMKKDIEPYNLSALDILKKIDIVNFFYKDNVPTEDPTIKHIGFIADESPEEVSTHYHDRMDYTNCIGLLIKAVQELEELIEKK